MKENLVTYIPRAVLFGAVMAALAFPLGWLRFPAGGGAFPPVWLQLLRIFLIGAAAFLLCSVLADLVGRRRKK